MAVANAGVDNPHADALSVDHEEAGASSPIKLNGAAYVPPPPVVDRYGFIGGDQYTDPDA